MSETYREEQEANIGEALMDQEELERTRFNYFSSTKDIDWEHDRNCELENDHEDENAPAEDNDPIQD